MCLVSEKLSSRNQCVHNGTTITSDVIHGVIRIICFQHVERNNMSVFIITSVVIEANSKRLSKIIQNLHKTSQGSHGCNFEYTVCYITNTPVKIFAKDIFIICRKYNSIRVRFSYMYHEQIKESCPYLQHYTKGSTVGLHDTTSTENIIKRGRRSIVPFQDIIFG